MLINMKKWIFAILVTALLCASSIYAILRLNHDPTLGSSEPPRSSRYAHEGERNLLEETTFNERDDEREYDVAENDDREILPNDLISDNVFITSSRTRNTAGESNSTYRNDEINELLKNDDENGDLEDTIALNTNVDLDSSIDLNSNDVELVALNDKYNSSLTSTETDAQFDSNSNSVKTSVFDNLFGKVTQRRNNTQKANLANTEDGELVAESKDDEFNASPLASENELVAVQDVQRSENANLSTTATILNELQTIAEKGKERGDNTRLAANKDRNNLTEAIEPPPDIGKKTITQRDGVKSRKTVSRVVDLRKGSEPKPTEIASNDEPKASLADETTSSTEIAFDDNVVPPEVGNPLSAVKFDVTFGAGEDQVEEEPTSEPDEIEIVFDDDVLESVDTEIALDDNTEPIEAVDSLESDETEIAFDDNIEQIEAVDSLESDETEIALNDNTELIEEADSIEAEETEIAFDDNAAQVENVDPRKVVEFGVTFSNGDKETDEDTSDADEIEIVFDDGELEADDSAIAFDDNAAQIEDVTPLTAINFDVTFSNGVEEVEGEAPVEDDEIEIVFDDEELEADDTEIAFDDNAVQVGDVDPRKVVEFGVTFSNGDKETDEDTSDADEIEIVFDDEELEADDSEIAFDDNAAQIEDVTPLTAINFDVTFSNGVEEVQEEVPVEDDEIEIVFDDEELEADDTEIAFDDNAVQVGDDDLRKVVDFGVTFSNGKKETDEDASEADEIEIVFDDEELEADDADIALDDTTEQIETLETPESEEPEIAFDENAESIEEAEPIEADDSEIVFDDTAEQIEEFESLESGDSEIVFDENAVSEDAEVTESEEGEIVFDENVAEPVEEVESEESVDTEIVFDENAVSEDAEVAESEDNEIVFDENVAEPVEEVESEESDDTEIVFDENAVFDDAEVAESEDNEIVFDENVAEPVEEVESEELVDTEIVFDENAVSEDAEVTESEESEIVFDENVVEPVEEVESEESVDTEIVFDDNEVGTVEEAEHTEADDTEIVFDDNEIQSEEAETVETDDSEIVFDDNDVQSDDAEASELDDGEIIFDSNDYGKGVREEKVETQSDENEIIFDDNDNQQESQSAEENSKGEDDVIIFDSNDLGATHGFGRAYLASQTTGRYGVRQASWEGNSARVRAVNYCVRLDAEEPEGQHEENLTESAEPTIIGSKEDATNANELENGNDVDGKALTEIEEAFASDENKSENVESIQGAESDALEKIEETLVSEEKVDSDASVSEQTARDDVVAQTQARAQVQVLDETWIISPNGGDDYLCWQLVNGAWMQTTANAFWATDDPSRTTVFWAHGYQTDMTSAVNSGFALRSALERARQASGSQKRVRFVIWKWASERNTARIRLDAMIKRDLTQFYGASLGRFAGRLNPRGDLVFVGFSFGAGVVGSALQTLATTANRRQADDNEPGFAVSGQGGSTPAEQKGKISLILVAAACNMGAFGRGGEFEYGGYLPELVLNLYNPIDYALHYYPAVANRSHALGIAPVSNEEFNNAWGNVYNVNVSGSLARKHSLSDAINATPYNLLIPFVL